MTEIPLEIRPAAALRLLAAGWSAADAVRELVGNAVRAGARHVWVRICVDTQCGRAVAYEVIDDGPGLDAAGLLAALSLGGPSAGAGLGLKAAAFSQGDRLELVSSPGADARVEKRVVSLPDVESSGRYAAQTVAPTAADVALMTAHLPACRGTVVRIGGIRRPRRTLPAALTIALLTGGGFPAGWSADRLLHVSVLPCAPTVTLGR